MGDIADMMIDGMMCETCGEYLGEGEGYPTQCASCKEENQEETKEKIKCSICNKKCKGEEGLNAHNKAKHQTTRQ